MLEAYRREFTNFQIARERDSYLSLTGQQRESRLPDIYDRYSDLYTLDTIDRLKKARAESNEYFERDTVGLDRLIAAAGEHYLNWKLLPLTREVANYEQRAFIEWQGNRYHFRQATLLLADESDPSRRRELYQRYLSAISPINDLRAERLEKLREQVLKLGYQGYQQMHEQLHKVDYAALDEQMQRFLTDTEKLYTVNLERAIATKLRMPKSEVSAADSYYLISIKDYDNLFPAELLLAAYQETMSDLGIKTARQSNLIIETRALSSGQSSRKFALQIPTEIRLVKNQSGGLAVYQQFFYQAGQAQQLAFTADNLRPEFKYVADNTLALGYGFLFNYLIEDPYWLDQIFDEREVGELKTATMLTRLYQIRRHAAKLHYELSLYGGNNSAEQYREQLSNATNLEHSSAEYLSDLSENLQCARLLRGWIFEVMLREFLRTKYGFKWWRQRRAAELLKEIWHTGFRYRLDEMATQLGLGQLIIEPLETDFFLNLKLS